MKKQLVFTFALLTGSVVSAQEAPKIKVSGYLETYYGYDFNKPADNNRPAFVYSHNRHNELNLNLGFIKGSYESDRVRANLALMAGTYANANLAAEPGVLKNIFEANAGLKLSKSAILWLDAGIFASHIGFESAVSKDCWVLTRNISSDNTPYYESGAKLSYTTANGRFTATALYLNGWQRIARQNGNSRPAGGLQFTWKPNRGVVLNYSNYLGSEGADSVRVQRFYHNFYGILQLDRKLGLMAGVDYGTQETSRQTAGKKEVFTAVAIARYRFAEEFALAWRVEYYEDKNGMIIASGIPNGFQTVGYSLNLDYAPVSNAVLRLEGKIYDGQEPVFARNTGLVQANALLTVSLAVSF